MIRFHQSWDCSYPSPIPSPSLGSPVLLLQYSCMEHFSETRAQRPLSVCFRWSRRMFLSIHVKGEQQVGERESTMLSTSQGWAGLAPGQEGCHVGAAVLRCPQLGAQQQRCQAPRRRIGSGEHASQAMAYQLHLSVNRPGQTQAWQCLPRCPSACSAPGVWPPNPMETADALWVEPSAIASEQRHCLGRRVPGRPQAAVAEVPG